MRLSISCATLVITVLGQSIVPVAAVAAVTLNAGGVTKLEVVVRDTSVSFSNEINDLFPVSLPFDLSHVAVQGSSNSRAEYHLNQDGFGITSVGTRAGSLDSRSNVQPGIYFSVSLDTPYKLTGLYSVDDPGLDAKFVQLDVTLADVDTASVLFHNLQESFGAVDEVFALGGTDGNQNNALSGSLTGMLTAGHRYRLSYGTSIYAANSGAPATANGTFQMSFVPEPCSAFLVFIAFSLLLLCRQTR
jgi:hypothetical protein